MIEGIERVEQRREVQLRRGTLSLWRTDGFARIAREFEDAFFDLPIAFRYLLRSLVAQRLEIFHVSLDGFCEIRERERKQIRVRQTQHRDAGRLCERATVDKGRVAEMCVPVKVVVDRMIDTALILSAVSQIERCNAEMIEESRVILS